jgi:hypothetical protein
LIRFDPGLAVGHADAVTNNYQVDNVHDFVGLMVALDDEGEFMWRCSGSLLADPTPTTSAS